MTNYLCKPEAAAVSGILASMTELVLEYKRALDFVLFKDFYVKYVKGRFADLMVYSRNFRFTADERKRYADLVIQFESVSVVNGDCLDVISDMNQSLLGLYD